MRRCMRSICCCMRSTCVCRLAITLKGEGREAASVFSCSRASISSWDTAVPPVEEEARTKEVCKGECECGCEGYGRAWARARGNREEERASGEVPKCPAAPEPRIAGGSMGGGEASSVREGELDSSPTDGPVDVVPLAAPPDPDRGASITTYVTSP